MKVALFDYGVGNLHSLGKALEAEDSEVRTTSSWTEALAADCLVLPGVGSFAAAVEALPPDRAPILEALAAGLPCLGVCLGMQLLLEESDEGPGEGLGWVRGRVRRLRASVVPQMGWNEVEGEKDALFPDGETLVAYYANSFVCEPTDPGHVAAWTEYGGDRFVAAVHRGNTWGVQFHPEKSSSPGRRLIQRFLHEAAAAIGHERARSAS